MISCGIHWDISRLADQMLYSDGHKSCTFSHDFFCGPLGRGANFGTGRFCKMEFSKCPIFSEEISSTVSE